VDAGHMHADHAPFADIIANARPIGKLHIEVTNADNRLVKSIIPGPDLLHAFRIRINVGNLEIGDLHQGVIYEIRSTFGQRDDDRPNGLGSGRRRGVHILCQSQYVLERGQHS